MLVPSCPWSDFAPGTVSFCERRLCAWIAEPSNAWSSVGYVVVGAVLLWHAGRRRDVRLVGVALAELLIGVGSFFFHASGTFLGEFFDQVGMFMLSCLILAFAYAYSAKSSPRTTAALYAGGVLGSSALLMAVRPIGIPLFAVQLFVGLAWELRHWQKSNQKEDFQDLKRGLGIFLLSFGVWILDITRVMCAPDNHLITGHAVWHVLNALCIERLYRFYARRFGA